MKKKISKVLVLILSVPMIFSSIPIQAFALTESSKYSYTETYLDAYYSTGTWQTADGHTHNNSGQVAWRNLKSTGEPLYCIQIYEGCTGADVTAANIESTNLWDRELTQTAKDGITRVSIYGYDGTSASTYGYSASDAQLATQVLLWEFETSKRGQFGYTDLPSFAENILANYPNAKACYKKIIEACADHQNRPSFSNQTVTLNGTGSGYSQTATTNGNGDIKLENLQPGTYTVTENSSDKYVAQKAQTVTVESGKTASVTFNNVLKKFRVTVTKTDAETGTAQGDATLAGAVYGIYNNGALVDTYTTDANGKFTTKYYVCGNNWTIKEISASEGYLLDETVYKVGADPKLYKVEHNTLEIKVTEQVIKGNISIIKHTDDGSTQIETPEQGAEFQIYLKSAGSFANADKNEKDTIVCDADGFASSKLLPYGVYTVHQTKGWDGRELMADFDVFIVIELPRKRKKPANR